MEDNQSFPEEGVVSTIDETSRQTILKCIGREFVLYELLLKPQVDTINLQSKIFVAAGPDFYSRIAHSAPDAIQKTVPLVTVLCVAAHYSTADCTN